MAKERTQLLDATVSTLDGGVVSLRQFTAGQTTVLVFLRHFG